MTVILPLDVRSDVSVLRAAGTADWRVSHPTGVCLTQNEHLPLDLGEEGVRPASLKLTWLYPTDLHFLPCLGVSEVSFPQQTGLKSQSLVKKK